MQSYFIIEGQMMAKILLVEDSPTQAVEMRMLLEEGSHSVQHVANGKQAVESLGRNQFELVVTDLEMPEMNGLELVKVMQLDFEHIPAVLVTASGSEELATKALQQGAAGYVPKNHLRALLNDTIVDVLGVIKTDASFAKLISTLQENSYTFDLPNDADLISPMVGLLMQVASGMELAGGPALGRMGTSIEHAVINAMFRGNLELGPSVTPSPRALLYDGATSNLIEKRKSTDPYQSRRVHVEATISKAEFRVLIRDQGKGFDTSKVPIKEDIVAADAESGHGLILMQSFTDELTFNDCGNQVTLLKRFA